MKNFTQKSLAVGAATSEQNPIPHDENNNEKTTTNDVIAVMLLQESMIYVCPDYISNMKRTVNNEGEEKVFRNKRILDECHASLQVEIERHRETICQWLYRVVDHCDLSREIVSVAMSYIDRFMASFHEQHKSSTVNGRMYQLVALTALYIAVKLYDHRSIRIEHFAGFLSGNRFSVGDIEEMEKSMLTALHWHVHPPTAVAFVGEFLKLLVVPGNKDAACEKDGDAVDYIFELARFFTELSLVDYQLCVAPNSPSMIAYASVLNAMDKVEHSHLDNHVRSAFLGQVTSFCSHLNPYSAEVKVLRQRLLETYNQCADMSSPCVSLKDSAAVVTPSTSPAASPVCVSGIDNYSYKEEHSYEEEQEVLLAKLTRTRQGKRPKKRIKP